MIEIKTGDIPCCVYVSDIKNHYQVKCDFLSDLNNRPKQGVYNKDESIFNTDYYNKEHINYKEIIYSMLDDYCTSLTNFLYYKEKIKIDKRWFQQYKKGDFHSWHRHPSCTFSNIYYLDHPEGTAKTTFRYLGREFEINVKEGQILTFPSYLEHCSKPNLSDKIKTVIAFNSN